MTPIDLSVRHASCTASTRAISRRWARRSGSSPRRWRRTMTPQLDDLEAEITYLLLRAAKPAGGRRAGHVPRLVDIVDPQRAAGQRLRAPAQLRPGRQRGAQRAAGAGRGAVDVRAGATSGRTVDAGAGRHRLPVRRRRAHRPVRPLVPGDTCSRGCRRGIPVSVHDVYHFRTTLPLHEGRVVVRWLDERGVPYFTPSRARARATSTRSTRLRGRAGAGRRSAGPGDNPMIFFRMPAA